jgi:two-component system C4-dicarboxylate transport response regulator DctD
MKELSRGSGIKQKSKKSVVVLIEPDASVREALAILLHGEGWTVDDLEKCSDLAAAIEDDDVIAVVSESSLPDCTPQEILGLCSEKGVPVIFTGHDMSLQGAVDLIRQGASDFLDKPFPQGRLVDLLNDLSTRQNA